MPESANVSFLPLQTGATDPSPAARSDTVPYIRIRPPGPIHTVGRVHTLTSHSLIATETPTPAEASPTRTYADRYESFYRQYTIEEGQIYVFACIEVGARDCGGTGGRLMRLESFRTIRISTDIADIDRCRPILVLPPSKYHRSESHTPVSMHRDRMARRRRSWRSPIAVVYRFRTQKSISATAKAILVTFCPVDHLPTLI